MPETGMLKAATMRRMAIMPRDAGSLDAAMVSSLAPTIGSGSLRIDDLCHASARIGKIAPQGAEGTRNRPIWAQLRRHVRFCTDAFAVLGIDGQSRLYSGDVICLAGEASLPCCNRQVKSALSGVFHDLDTGDVPCWQNSAGFGGACGGSAGRRQRSSLVRQARRSGDRQQ